MAHQPLVILDGAHNPAGADTAAEVMADDFDPVGRRILVTGFLRGRDPAEMLGALRIEDYDVVIVTTPPSPRAVPAEETAAAARALGVDEVVIERDVVAGVKRALRLAAPDDAVLVTGSLYVVGAARPYLDHALPG